MRSMVEGALESKARLAKKRNKKKVLRLGKNQVVLAPPPPPFGWSPSPVTLRSTGTEKLSLDRLASFAPSAG
jgi:hypothetical protein